MARKKVTITLDRLKAEEAKALLDAGSTSEASDVALDRLIRTERLRRDIAAHRRLPPTGAEVELALIAARTTWTTRPTGRRCTRRTSSERTCAPTR